MISMRSQVWELEHKLIKGDNLAFVHSISFNAGAYDGVVKGKACAQPASGSCSIFSGLRMASDWPINVV